MKFVDREFVPVLLGGDINAYSVARAFYEQYQVKSIVIGKYGTGPSYRSRIADYRHDPAIDTYDTFLRTVNALAGEHADKTVVLMGCGDSYVALVAQAKDAGFEPITLGRRILRTETAGLTVMSWLMYRLEGAGI